MNTGIRAHSRQPRTTLSVRWLLTVCHATAWDRLPWVGLPTAHHGPPAQGAAAAGPRRQCRKYNFVPTMCPESRSAITATHPSAASMWRRKRGSIPLIAGKLIWSTRTLICSADAVATATMMSPTSRHVGAQGTATGQIFPLAATGQITPSQNGKQGKIPGQRDYMEPPGGIEPPIFSLPSIHAMTL
jgi:hypothetical protein